MIKFIEKIAALVQTRDITLELRARVLRRRDLRLANAGAARTSAALPLHELS
jgi:hypothetical protein